MSVRRCLTTIACIAAFFGFTWVASSNGIALATVPAVTCAALAFGVMSRRYVWSFAIVASLTCLSLLTTSIVWDGGFPFAQLKIQIVNAKGDPISNATLIVSRRTTGKPANRYPIAEFEGTPLTSDSTGTVICHQTRSGLQFGGRAWELFWCVPLGEKAPQFDVHIDHAKYARTSISVWRLFESNYEYYADFPKTTIDLNGRIEEIPIYEQRIVMFER